MFLGSFRRWLSRAPEASLRWLTASVVRSTAIFVVLTFVPILLLTYYIVATSVRSSKAEAIRADAEARNFATVLLHTSFHSETEALGGVADEASLHRALRRVHAATMTEVLGRFLRRRPEFSLAALYDTSGTLLAQAAPRRRGGAAAPNAPLYVSGASWFQAALHSPQAYISPLTMFPDQPPALILAVPVASDDTPGGVLMATLPATVVQDWVRRVGIGPERYLYLIDGNQQVVYSPAQGSIAAADAGTIPGVTPALAGASGTVEFLTARHLESQVVSYAPLPEAREAVLVVRPVRFSMFFLRVFYDKVALIAIIVFLLAVAGGVLLRAAFRYYLRYTRAVESGRNKTEALLSSIADGVVGVDDSLRVIEFNPAAANLTGRAPQEALGRPYTEVIQLMDEASEQAPVDLVSEAIERKRSLRFARSLRLRRADGGSVPVTVNAAPVIDAQGGVNGCVVVFSDVSQEREVDQMKTEFISLASHQLRTPMSGVKGALSLLLDEVLGPLSAEQKQYLGRAYDANERLIALVSDLLNVSRLEQGRLQLIWEPVDLGRLLEGVVGEQQNRAQRYAQDLALELDGDRLQVLGDAVRLREVFANLVDNAVKYTPERGRIRVRAQGEAGAVAVEIADTGVGIPNDKIPALFQKFARIQNSLSAREVGTGLGLYFAKSVIELHHGTIDVTSDPGRGTTFRVRLPRPPVTATTSERTTTVSGKA